jgi:hypothetical protein
MNIAPASKPVLHMTVPFLFPDFRSLVVFQSGMDNIINPKGQQSDFNHPEVTS